MDESHNNQLVLNESAFFENEDLTIKNAVLRVLSHVGDNLIFDGNQFFRWSGYYWEYVEPDLIERIGYKLIKNWTRSKSGDFHRALALNLKRETNLNPLCIPLKNYSFNLENFCLEQSITFKSYHMIGHLPVNYISSAKAPKWTNFLNEVMKGDQQKINVIQEFFGYCFLGDNRYQQALVLLGAGNNGKSVLLEVLSSLFDKISYLNLKQIEDERYVHGLQGAWVNIASELAYKSVETTSNIKAAIAGEVIHAAPKYHKGFDFKPRAKIAFATNGLPRNNDTSEGYFRRLLIIDMNYTIVKPNRNLTSELLKEKAGIFLWSIEGLKRLMNRGSFDFENPYIEKYKEESSSLFAWWIEEGENWLNSKDENIIHNISLEEIEAIQIGEPYFKTFYRVYANYCQDGGMRPAGRNKIRSEIERLQLPLVVFNGTDNKKRIKLQSH